MKKIISFTSGWNPNTKLGYFTATFEDGRKHLLKDICLQELLLLHEMFRNPPVYIDSAKWIISGWAENQ